MKASRGALQGVARTIHRAAATGRLAARTAARLRRLRHADAGQGAADRAAILRDAAREVLRLHGLSVEVQGGPPPEAALLVANHVSWLDPLAVASAVACVPISKADVGSWPVVGGLARDLGTIFFRRGDRGSGARVIREAEEAMRRGLPVLNFPEGTTTDGSTVREFRRGLFGAAARARLPVVPVAIAYAPRALAWTGDASFVPHYLRLAAAPGGRVTLRFGDPLAPGEGAAGLAAAARTRVLDLLGGVRAAAVGA